MKFEVPDVDLNQAPVSLLAYLGDAVMSLYYKTKLSILMKPSRIEPQVRKIVSKEGQAEMLDRLWNDLTDEEMNVVKRAMNSRSAKRHGNDPLYRKSTGLEALIGYLYLSGREDRIKELLEVQKFTPTKKNGEL